LKKDNTTATEVKTSIIARWLGSFLATKQLLGIYIHARRPLQNNIPSNNLVCLHLQCCCTNIRDVKDGKLIEPTDVNGEDFMVAAADSIDGSATMNSTPGPEDDATALFFSQQDDLTGMEV